MSQKDSDRNPKARSRSRMSRSLWKTHPTSPRSRPPRPPRSPRASSCRPRSRSRPRSREASAPEPEPTRGERSRAGADARARADARAGGERSRAGADARAGPRRAPHRHLLPPSRRAPSRRSAGERAGRCVRGSGSRAGRRDGCRDGRRGVGRRRGRAGARPREEEGVAQALTPDHGSGRRPGRRTSVVLTHRAAIRRLDPRRLRAPSCVYGATSLPPSRWDR